MTAVEFHTGIALPLDFACRLLRKAYRRGARALVMAPGAALAQLDERLWTFDAHEFVPHLRWRAQLAAQAARTPVWLVAGEVPEGAPPLLVNLGADAVAVPTAFERIIEIVGVDDESRRAARLRWRQYEACGLGPIHHAAAEAG